MIEAIAAMAGRSGLMRFAALDDGIAEVARELDDKLAALIHAVTGVVDRR